MKLFKYNLEITVFFTGAIIMIYELIGSRILGPYFGTSIFVWTSLIGIILASLSLGYFLGGKLSDQQPTYTKLSLIIFTAGIFIGLTSILKDIILILLYNNIHNIKYASVISSLIIFAPPSILLGIVSPYSAKLKLKNLENSGSTIGNLYALSTAGSIFGTFLAGFYLIPHFGTNKLLIILTISLIIISSLIAVTKISQFKIISLLFLAASWFFLDKYNQVLAKQGFIDVDTAYNRIWIYDTLDSQTNKTVRTFLINNENSSATYLEDKQLVFEYTKFYHLARFFNPDFTKTLMFGGAGYSFPKNFIETYPQASIDVVEIDPGVTELAKKYFNLQDNPRLNIFHQDGRDFLNKCNEKYDVIFGDAFNSHFSIPYQLTTTEAVQKKYDILNDNGLVILNLISAIDGEKGHFLQAEYKTYQKIFPQVYLFPVRDDDPTITQNIILVALKSPVIPTFHSDDQEINNYLKHLWQGQINQTLPVLTDDYCPVEYYINQAI